MQRIILINAIKAAFTNLEYSIAKYHFLSVLFAVRKMLVFNIEFIGFKPETRKWDVIFFYCALSF